MSKLNIISINKYNQKPQTRNKTLQTHTRGKCWEKQKLDLMHFRVFKSF